MDMDTARRIARAADREHAANARYEAVTGTDLDRVRARRAWLDAIAALLSVLNGYRARSGDQSGYGDLIDLARRMTGARCG